MRWARTWYTSAERVRSRLLSPGKCPPGRPMRARARCSRVKGPTTTMISRSSGLLDGGSFNRWLSLNQANSMPSSSSRGLARASLWASAGLHQCIEKFEYAHAGISLRSSMRSRSPTPLTLVRSSLLGRSLRIASCVPVNGVLFRARKPRKHGVESGEPTKDPRIPSSRSYGRRSYSRFPSTRSEWSHAPPKRLSQSAPISLFPSSIAVYLPALRHWYRHAFRLLGQCVEPPRTKPIKGVSNDISRYSYHGIRRFRSRTK